MLLVLDSNQYIFALGPSLRPACELLLEKLIFTAPAHRVRIPRLIIEEVKDNVSPENIKDFLGLLRLLTTIDEDTIVPFELGAQYEALGLKPSDAFIGSFTEFVGAEILVSENRHFLSRVASLPFRVLSAERCLKLLR